VVSKIGLIAGGTGITPMLQIIHAVVQENSGIELYLLYAVQREEDILLRQTIEDLAVSHFTAITSTSIITTMSIIVTYTQKWWVVASTQLRTPYIYIYMYVCIL
jgi:NAD(P)H-flavin reductase